MDEDIIKIKMIEVISSNVAEIGYCDDRNILAIQMFNGHIFYYLDIPKIHFTEMLKCNNDGVGISSIGSYLHRNIKGKYRYIRVA